MTITYNSNPQPNPFGSSQSVGLDVGFTTFLGLSVSSFSVQADWRSRGGVLEVVLVEDENLDQKLQDVAGNFPVIGSPHKFELKNLSDETIFSFAGILDSITSSYSPEGGKTYNVKIASPLRLLENSVCIFDGYAGFGYGVEGIPSQPANANIPTDGYGLSSNGYYQNLDQVPSGYELNYWNHTTSTQLAQTLDEDLTGAYGATSPSGINHVPSSGDNYGITFGTNNRAIKWENIYNTLNLYGFFENASHGLDGYATYGGARTQGGGMRLDMIITALEEIINNTSSSSDNRYHGGNILSGTSTYNIAAVASGDLASNPYYYGFDASGFYAQISDKLGPDWIYPTENSSLIDFIASAAEYAGLEFIVELDTSVAASGGITQTYPNTVYGGDITIRTLDKTVLRGDRPFSDLAHFVLRVQEPDFGDFGSYDNIHPGIAPTGADVFYSLPDDGASYTGVYTDPFQHDFTNVGQSASYPYGGKFPVAETGDSRGASIRTFTHRLKDATVSLRDTKDVTGRFITGGYQSRMVKVPGYHIYQYWGEIEVSDYNESEPACINYNTISKRSIPVVTPILDGDDIYPFILMDVKDIFPFPMSETGWPAQVAYKGIYRTSPAELRAAMKSEEAWEIFLNTYKPCMYAALLKFMGVSDVTMSSFISNAYYRLVLNSGEYDATIDTARVPTVESSKGKNDNNDSLPVGDPKGNKRDEEGNNQSGFKNTELKQRLYEKVKAIGDEHYGKSWVAWTPYIDTKITSSGTNIMSDYEKSWNPASDAYLEPAAFNEYQAPQSNKFVNGGRTQSYANYYYNFAFPTGDHAYREYLIPQLLLEQTGVYDFSEVSKDDMYVTDYCVNYGEFVKTHIRTGIDSQYIYLPYDYFAYYNNGDPYGIDHYQTRLNDSGVFEIRDYNYQNIHFLNNYNTLVANQNIDIYAGTDRAGTDPNTEAYLIKSQPAYSGDPDVTYVVVGTGDAAAAMEYTVCPDTGNNQSFIDDFLGLVVPDHGVNCHHFVKFTTPRVYYPRTDDLTGISRLFATYVRDAYSDLVSPTGINVNNKQDIMEQVFTDGLLARKTVEPVEVGIPQQSTRYRYGPWVTDNNFIYAGKMEYTQDDTLVPENFILPLYGDPDPPGFNLAENFSGTAGMNLAGQAIANAIDGYKPFAVEEGSLTIPGPPIIESIGDRIVIDEYTGPIVTDIQCSITANSIETTYTFSSTRDKVGLPTRDMITKLRNLSQKRVNRRTRS